MASSPSSSSNSKLTLKLLIDTNNNRVLFAETSKPVVDFIFNLLSLPLATVVKILRNNEENIGGFTNLYQSIEDLDDRYVQSQQSRDHLLNPRVPIFSNLMAKLLSTIDGSSGVFDFLLNAELESEDDEEDKDYVEEEDDEEEEDEDEYDDEEEKEEVKEELKKWNDDIDITKVAEEMDAEKNIVMKNEIVKDDVTYLVMDDLVIHPLVSAIAMIELLNSKLSVKEMGALKQTVVEFGVDEGIKLLKACQQSNSKMILTSVFINKEDLICDQ